MSVTNNLNFARHQQDTRYYCGAACAQMVLGTMKPSLDDQSALFLDAKNNSALDPLVPWNTAPDGLAWIMNNNRPPGSLQVFKAETSGTEVEMSRRICWMIHQHQRAPIALVGSAAHWVVVHRYEANHHPAGPNDATCLIDSFYIYDPAPALPSSFNWSFAPPPPHSVGDGCKATPKITIQDHLTYDQWQQHFTAVLAGNWATKYVAVGVDDAASAPVPLPLPPPPPSPKPKNASSGQSRPRQRRRRGDRLVTPSDAARLADEGIRAYGLYSEPDWGRALSASRPQPGRLVHRLDYDDKFYSIVSYRSGRGTTVVATVDARAGVYQRAGLLARAQQDLIHLSPEEAFRLIADRRIDLPNDGGRLLVRKDALSLYPHLVWRPCLESLSPFHPFYLFTVGSRQIFVRVDGAVFFSLTQAWGA